MFEPAEKMNTSSSQQGQYRGERVRKPGAGRKMGARPTGPGTALANFLIEKMPRLGLSNEIVADKLGYARPNIVSLWKTARTKVTIDAIYKLSELLEVPLAYMMALYFEQYISDNYGGVDHFPEIVGMMQRTVTKEEFEVVRAIREARHFNSIAAEPSQLAQIKKLFSVPASTEEGPLKPFKMRFGADGEGDRTRWERRGSTLDVSEAEDRRHPKSRPGPVRKKGKRAGSR